MSSRLKQDFSGLEVSWLIGTIMRGRRAGAGTIVWGASG